MTRPKYDLLGREFTAEMEEAEKNPNPMARLAMLSAATAVLFPEIYATVRSMTAFEASCIFADKVGIPRPDEQGSVVPYVEAMQQRLAEAVEIGLKELNKQGAGGHPKH